MAPFAFANKGVTVEVVEYACPVSMFEGLSTGEWRSIVKCYVRTPDLGCLIVKNHVIVGEMGVMDADVGGRRGSADWAR